MNTLLVKMGAAPKKRSLLLLLLLVGFFSVVNATTYYTATTGTASISSAYAPTNIYTSAAATTLYSTALTSADVIVVQGAILTTNAAIVVQATSGGLTVSGGIVTISTASTFSSAVSVSGTSTGITLGAITVTINADLSLGTGATLSVPTSATAVVNGNLIMTGGTIALSSTSGGTFKVSGNVAGNAAASQRGWGTITGKNNSSYFIFSKATNFGTGGSTSATSATITGDAAPQKLYFVNGTSTDGGVTVTPGTASGSYSFRVQTFGYVQLQGNSALPQGCQMYYGTANSNLIDLNGFNLSLGFFMQTVLVRGGTNGNGTSSLQINGTNNGSGGTSTYWGNLTLDQSNVAGGTNLVNLNMTMGTSYSADNKIIQLSTNVASNSTSSTLTGASSSATVVTCASTTGLNVGNTVTVASGTGAFAANTYVVSITDATHFVVNATPTTALSGGASISVNWLGVGIVYLNGFTVSAPSFPAASASSFYAVGNATNLTPNIGGSLVLTSPPSSGSATLPLGLAGTTRGISGTVGAIYTPVTFANTSASSTPSLTVSASALNNNIITGASCALASTNVTCTSTSGLSVGATVTMVTGTGVLAGSTTILSITDATHFVISTAPTTALSAATVLAVNSYTNSNVYGDGTTSANNTVPYQYTIASSVASTQSTITFQYPTINAGLTSPSSTAQLGAILSTNSTGYNGMTTNLATLTLANSVTPFTATTASTYTLPGSANATTTYVIGNLGAVYPTPTLNAITNTTVGLNSTVNIALAGTNITSLTSSGKPSWLTLSKTSSTAGSLSGSTQSSSSSSSITINAVNVAGTASRTFTYVEGNFPNITSASTATAIVGGSLNYVVTTSSSANSYAISGSLPSGLSFSTSTGTISGTLDAGTAGSYSVTLTATNTVSSLSGNPFSLTITVLDAPTVNLLSATPAGISPASQAVDFGSFIITVNGTNFVNGFSTVTFAGNNLATTFVSATQLTATVPASLVARTVSSSTPAVGVTNAGTNTGSSTPTNPSTSSNTVNYTITVLTPTITAVSPAATVVGAPTTTITVTGTNFITGVSTVTFNGSATGVTTTYVSSTSLTATLSSTLLSSAGVAAIRVANVGAGLSPTTASSQTFTVYADGALWPLTATGAPIVGLNTTGSTLNTAAGSTNILPINTAANNASFTTAGLKYIANTAANNYWTTDNVSIVNYFQGNNSLDASQNRYIQFDATTDATHNLTVNNITIPLGNFVGTQGTTFKLAYSLDGFTSSGYTDLGQVGGNTSTSNPFITSGTTRTFSYTTPIVVRAGSTLSVRVIPSSNNSTSIYSGGYINLSNVVIGGTATTAYPSPVITSTTGTVTGNAADTYTASSPLYTFAASTTQGTVTYSASGLTGTGYSLDASTGKITGTYVSTSGGTFNATLTADNGNLFPVSTVITFNIAGKPLTPSVTTIVPATSKVDTTAFTLTVNGTNFVSGKSAVTWNGTALTTTYVSTTQLTAAVPASYVAGNVITDNTVTIGVYNTDADAPASTVNQTYTITNTTPTIAALSPAGVVAGNADFTLSVYGSNFHTGSKIVFNGTQLTTTFVNSFQLTASVAAANVSTAATKNIVVNNVFPNGASQSTASSSFIVGNAGVTWSMASYTPTSSGSIVAAAPTLTNYTTGTNGSGVTYNEVFPGGVADGSTSTADPTFAGLTTAPGSALVAAKSIDFKITPADNTQMTISAITIPILANGNGMAGVIGYSTDGINFTKISTATNTSSATSGSTIVNTNDFGLGNGNLSITNYVFPSPISVPNGTTLTIRVIPWRKSSSASIVPVNIGPLTVIGNTTPQAIPDAPSISSLADGSTAVDVSFTAPTYTGTTAITSYKVYAYTNSGATLATSVSANVSSLTLPYHINVTGLTNGTSYTFKVSATNGAGEGALSTISSAVIPSNNTTWTVTGGVGSWDHGDPDLGDQNATINGNYTLSKALNCLKLTVASGVTVATNGFNFTVQGNLVNNGTISGTGTLLLNTTAAQTISGTGTVGNLTVNNTSGGVTITSGSGNKFGVSGVLNLKSGVVTTNGNLVFKSTSIANTGTLAALDGVTNTGSISGTVTVERYIPAGFRGYRDLAPQVNNAGSIYNNWQEGGALTSGYGIFITGPSATHADNGGFYGSSAASAQPAPASSGLDYSINGYSSAFTYNNTNSSFYSLYASGKIDSIYNTTTINLEPFTGYRVLVRGDRGFNLAKTPISNIYNYGLLMYNPTVLRSTGNVITGTVTYATNGVTNTSVGSTYRNAVYGLNGTTNKFSMIANPYIAPVMWGTGTATNSNTTTVYGASSGINGTYWYLDPTHSATGTYGAYNALSGSVYPGNTTSAYIQPGQAFFVQTNGASPTVVFNETAKATSVAKVAVFGVTSPLSKIYFTLLKQDTGSSYIHADAAAIAFSTGFTNATYGPQDALKFGSSSDNLFIADKGNKLSIDGRLPATASDAISLGISSVTSTSYKLEIDATNYITNGFAPYLVDSYRGTSTALTTGVNEVKFTADAKVTASFENRFSLAFKPTTLAVNSVVASASLNNKIATISWNTVGEKSVSRFEVEKSIDAVSFTKIAQSTAKNTSSASYSATDNSVATTSYYRIKVISEVGSVSYSNVVKLSTIDSKLSTYSLYPNPLKGSKVVNVSLSNVTAGKYTVSITNVLGQKVQVSAISHAGGNASYAITLNNTLAAGTYNVAIRETASGNLVHQLGLSVQP